MRARITPWAVANEVRKAGIDVPANAFRAVREELGIGRYLRTPALGWVLDTDEAKQLADALRERFSAVH